MLLINSGIISVWYIIIIPLNNSGIISVYCTSVCYSLPTSRGTIPLCFTETDQIMAKLLVDKLVIASRGQ